MRNYKQESSVEKKNKNKIQSSKNDVLTFLENQGSPLSVYRILLMFSSCTRMRSILDKILVEIRR